MNVKDISNKYSELYSEHKTKQDKLRNSIHRKEAQLERLNNRELKLIFPSWVDNLLQPIATELGKHLPDYRAEILGPFGICCETSIHFYKKGLTKEELWRDEHRRDGSIKSITFIPGDLSEGQISIRDEKTDTHRFSPGTIGALNGMNHPSINIPEDATIEWLLAYVS